MKKLYMVGLAALVITTAGCTIKAPIVPELTGDVQEVISTTEDVIVVTGSEMEEFTGEFDEWIVPTVEGNDQITAAQSGTTNEVKSLIADRKTKPSDTTKLTEEDISLMEQIIQKIQDLGK